jgi:hypothetical protein
VSWLVVFVHKVFMSVVIIFLTVCLHFLFRTGLSYSCSYRINLGYLESFKYLGSILTNDGKCTCEIKCRIAMAKAAFSKKRALFTSTLDLGLRKKLVKCYI